MKFATAGFLRLSSLLAARCKDSLEAVSHAWLACSLKKSLWAVSHALLACSLLGCFETKQEPRLAGGDDYPNGVEHLGKKAAQARADSADWNGFDSVPRSAPGLYDTVTVPDSVPDTSGAGAGAPAPKRSAGSAASGRAYGSVADTCIPGGLLGVVCPLDTLVTKVIDTAKGTVAAVHTVVDDSGVTRKDSTVIVKADPSRPGSVGGVSQVVRSVVSRDSSRVDVWKFTDADGNGILEPRPGAANKVAIEATLALPGGMILKQTRILAAGADLDFNARGDNALLAATTATLLGGDTVAIVRLVDVDGDSVLIDFSKDSNLVDLFEARNFPESSALVTVTRQVRIVASKDSARNYPVRFEERKTYRDGAILDVAARGLGPDSAFGAGQEARWSETLHLPPSASLPARKARTFRVRLGPVPGAFAANLLLGWSVEETLRSAHGHFGMDFLCETPVADGRWSADGDVIAWLVQKEGRLTFAGAATPAGMQGHATGPDGESAVIAYDPAGDILDPKP